MEKDSRILKNTFSQALSRGLVILVSLLTTAILTRLFGVAGYGNYVFITSFVILFVGLTDLGTTIIGVRESSREKEKAGRVFGNILSLRLVLAAVLFILFNLLIYFLPQFSGLRLAALLASLVLPFLILRTTIQAILQTFLRLDLASLMEVFASVIFLILLLFFYFFYHLVSLPFLMVIWAASSLFSGIFGLFFSQKFLSLRFLWQKEEIKKIFREAAPLGIYLLIYSVYDRGIDSFFLKTFSGSDTVGYYGLAYKVHGNLILGAAFLMNSLFPLLSSLKNDEIFLKKIFTKAMTVLLSASILIFVSVFLFAPAIINIIAGKEFFPAVLLLRILLGATFFSYLNHLTGYSMVALGEQKKLFQFSLVALAINFFLNLIFIPHFGAIAAAVATILTELSLFVLTKNFLKRKYNLTYFPKNFLENLKIIWKKRENFFEN